MKFRAPIVGGALVSAGGLGYWLATPAAVASLLLGAAAACACAARLSDNSEAWANCAVANAAIDGRLTTLFEGVDGTAMEDVPDSPRSMSDGQVRLLKASIVPVCGSFDNARAKDIALRSAREKAGYEELFVPGTFEDALALSSSGYRYQARTHAETKLLDSGTTPNA